MEKRRCMGCMRIITEETCPHCGYCADQNNDYRQLPVGTLLRGQYLVGRVLGQGGFGITYIGLDTYLDMVVAIKEFYPASIVSRNATYSPSVQLNTVDMESHYLRGREKFLTEGRTLAKLRNAPNIVTIYNLFAENNTAYIVMEYIQGTDLRQYIRKKGGKIPAAELFSILEPIFPALDAVHKAGLVHRDISPDNIMLKADGTVKLLDFGAARDSGGDDADIDMSHSTEAIVKHGLAPAEQYRNRGNLGPWTDEYALCATIYYCLTGKVPPDALVRLTEDIHPDWNVPGLTSRQQSALEQGMSTRAKNRFGSIKALHEHLYENQDPDSTSSSDSPEEDPPDGVNPGEDKPAVPPALPDPPVKKSHSPFVLIAGIAFAIVLLLGIFLFPGRERDNHGDMTKIDFTASDITENVTLATSAATLSSQESAPWEANLLKPDPLSRWAAEKHNIHAVTFLDTLSSAPKDAEYLSQEGNGTVLGWLAGEHLFIAAKDGINGRDSCAGLFAGCSELTTVVFGRAFHTEQVTDMSSMFAGCHKLNSVDVESLATANVFSMQQMFDMRSPTKSGSALEKLDVSGWDVSNVRSMAGMFAYCNNLQELDVSLWNVSNVSLMNSMFSDCHKLTALPVSNWNVSEVGTMNYMFVNCRSLVSLDVTHWDVSSLTSMQSTFSHCEKLENLNVGNWNVSNVTSLENAFSYCVALRHLDVVRWDVSSVISMNHTFANTGWQLQPQISGWDLSMVADYDSFFTDGRTVDGSPWTDLFTKRPAREQKNTAFILSPTEFTVSLFDVVRIELPEGISPADVKWHTANSDIAEVSSAGIITAFHSGTTTITADYYGQIVSLIVHVP